MTVKFLEKTSEKQAVQQASQLDEETMGIVDAFALIKQLEDTAKQTLAGIEKDRKKLEAELNIVVDGDLEISPDKSVELEGVDKS